MNRKYSPEKIKKMVENKGDKLLSIQEDVNFRTRLIIECNKCKYVRNQQLCHFIEGFGCKKCGNSLKRTQEEASEILQKLGFILLGKYNGNGGKVQVKCVTCNYEWFPIFSNISRNSGCPNCSNKVKYTYEKVKEVVESRGGKLLSKSYKNIDTKLEVECLSCTTIWTPTFRALKNKHWCPTCANTNDKTKSQRKLVEILRSIFTKKEIISNYKGFKWLRSSNNRQQEVDVWIPSIKLAIEYDGAQHFKAVKHFGGEERLVKQQKLDKNKNKLIKKSKEVKYFIRISYKEELSEDNIRNILKKHSIPI